MKEICVPTPNMVMCGDGCPAIGEHPLVLHNAYIRQHYTFDTRDVVGAPLHECTCGIKGTHSLEEHDEEIRKVHGVISSITTLHETHLPDPFLVAGLEAAVRYCTGENDTPLNVMRVALSFAEFLRKDGKVDGL